MLKIGFLGGGRMAQALAKGFISAGLSKGEKIVASCAPEDNISTEAFKNLGAEVTFKNEKIVKESEVVILAVKPNVVPTVLNDIRSSISAKNLILSVAMGVPLQQLEKALPNDTRIIRVMPNTAALVQKSASVFATGSNVSNEDIELTKKLFNSVGTCDQVGEYLLDAVTALSGSGPAYVFLMIESLADGAVRMGMPRDLAYKLASQTVVGAGQMVLELNQHPAALKDNVTSPAGSTAEGLYCLEEGGMRAAIIKAIERATNRCKIVSKQDH